jgi:hypothetical protein
MVAISHTIHHGVRPFARGPWRHRGDRQAPVRPPEGAWAEAVTLKNAAAAGMRLSGKTQQSESPGATPSQLASRVPPKGLRIG